MNEQLSAALVAAMGEIHNPSRDAKANAGSYGYSYLSYDALSDHLRPILAKHGLAWVHPIWNDSQFVMVGTTIVHVSGESVEFGPLVWPMLPKVQDFGGLISYLKRYSLISTFGMGAGDDNDAQTVPHTERSSTPVGNLTGPAAKNMTGAASPKQVGMIKGLMRDQHVTEPTLNDFTLDRLGFELPTDGLEHLTKGQASAIIEAMIAVKGDEGKPITRTRPTSPDPDDPWADVPLPMEPTR